MLQRYEPAVRVGDKRIILVDGEPMGALNRVPPTGEARSNMHVGGRPEKSPLTERDLEICAAIGPTLRDQGMIFVGIDVIGDYLTEINVTSPTGLQEIARFDGVHIEKSIWDRIEAKVGILIRSGRTWAMGGTMRPFASRPRPHWGSGRHAIPVSTPLGRGRHERHERFHFQYRP